MYNKRVWKDDDLITPEDMNRIENGIANNDSNTSGISVRISAGFNEVKDAISTSENNIIERIDRLSNDNEESFSTVLTTINDKTDLLSDKIDAISISSSTDSSEFQNRVENSVASMNSIATVINDRLQEIEDETTRVKDRMDSALSQMNAIPEINSSIQGIDTKYESLTTSSSEIKSTLSDIYGKTSSLIDSVSLINEKIDRESERASVADNSSSTAVSELSSLCSNKFSEVINSFTPITESQNTIAASVESVSGKLTNIGSGISTVKNICDEIKAGLPSGEQSSVDNSAQLSSIETSISSLNSLVTILSNSLVDLSGKVSSLSNRVYSIWESSLTSIDPSTFSTYNETDKNVLINTDTPLTSMTNVTAKSIEIENLIMMSTRLSLTAENSVNISNFASAGNLAKAVSNAALSINTNDNVSIVNSNIAQTGYNSIEIGLSNTSPKSVMIQNVNFNEPLSNNAILIFAHANNAEISIKDCYFKEVSNVLRISNRTNNHATIYLTNCKIDKWDADPGWAGAIIFEDYTSADAAACQANDLFNKDKLRFIISDVYGPDGNKITAADLTRSDSQGHFAYIWNNNEGFVNYSDAPDRYPTFIFN